MAGIVKEWHCIEHGHFESSHPICPNFGCDSEHVSRAFLTAPAHLSSATRRHAEGIRRSADMMGLSNFRSARAGEAAYGGDVGKELGQELLWGNEVQAKMGKSFTDLTGMAHQPFSYTKADGSTETMTRNNALVEAATEMGITRRAIPKAAELTVAPADKPSMDRARTVTA